MFIQLPTKQDARLSLSLGTITCSSSEQRPTNIVYIDSKKCRLTILWRMVDPRLLTIS